MAIEQMLLLNMTFDKEQLSSMLKHLKNSEDIYLQPSNKIVKEVKDVSKVEIDSTYSRILEKLELLSKDINLSLDTDLTASENINLNKIETFINEKSEEVKKIVDIREQIVIEKEENETTLTMLKHLNFSQVDLDNLLNCNYVTARFGRIKQKYISGINYFKNKPFVYQQLGKDKNYVWCVYIAVNNSLAEIDNLFKSIDFEEIEIPYFVHGTVDKAREELQREIDAMNEYIERMDQKISILRETNKLDILKMYTTLKHHYSIEQYKQYIVDYKNKYAVYGFVSKRNIKEIETKFNDIEGIEYSELPSDILENQGVLAPRVIYNSFISRPFEVLSNVTLNDSLDTTNAIAVLGYLVSMLFLGDIGIALVSLILGILLRKNKFGKLFIATAISLFIGGLLYGSLFYGYSLFNSVLSYIPLTRVLNGIVLLVLGLFSINCIKDMYNESIVTKLFSLKGLSGNIAIYTLLVYLLSNYELNINISFTPVLIVLIICVASIIVRTVLHKRMN